MKSMFGRIISCGAAVILAVGGALASPATPAEAAPKVSTHCGVTAVWSASFTKKLSKNVSLTYRGANINKATTVYCLVAKRKTVAKRSYLALALNGHPGRYTSGKSVKRLLTIPHGEVGVVVLRLFTKKGDRTNTIWTSAKQYFG